MIIHDTMDRLTNTYSWAYWDNVLTPEQCDTLVDKLEMVELKPGTTLGESTARKSKVSFHKADHHSNVTTTIDHVITQLNNRYFGFDLNGYDEFQYTVYDSEEQGKYDWHMDLAMGKNFQVQTRKLSAVMQLNDGFEGGKFQINTGDETQPENIPMAKGKLVVFPSWMIHRVLPVTYGIRRSLVIWVVGPKFK